MKGESESTGDHRRSENESGESIPLLSRLAGDEDMLDIIEMFVAEMPERVRQIEAMVDDEDVLSLARIASQMKGAAEEIGFTPITEAAERVEVLLLPGQTDMEQLSASVRQLCRLCLRASAERPRG